MFKDPNATARRRCGPQEFSPHGKFHTQVKIPRRGNRTEKIGRPADPRRVRRIEQRRTRYLQTVIQEGVDNFNGEARGAVQAIPLCIIRWTRVHVECDVRSIRRRRRPRFRRRARRAGICRQRATINRRAYVCSHRQNGCNAPFSPDDFRNAAVSDRKICFLARKINFFFPRIPDARSESLSR